MKPETPHPTVALLEASDRKVWALRRTLFDLKAGIDGLAQVTHEFQECVHILQKTTPYCIASVEGLAPEDSA